MLTGGFLLTGGPAAAQAPAAQNSLPAAQATVAQNSQARPSAGSDLLPATAMQLPAADSLPAVLREEVYGVFKLPDLQSCIDSTLANSPLLKTTDEQVAQLLEDIKIQKRSLGEYVLVDANTRYGLFNQLSVADPAGTGSTPGLDLYAAEERFNYYAGLTLRLPLSYLWSNNNKVKKLKYSINEAELKREELKKEIIRMVVTEYYKLKSSYEVLGIHQINVQTSELDYLKAKNDMQNSLIKLSEYSTITYSYRRSFEEYVVAKNEFLMQYHLLKLLTGSEF